MERALKGHLPEQRRLDADKRAAFVPAAKNEMLFGVRTAIQPVDERRGKDRTAGLAVHRRPSPVKQVANFGRIGQGQARKRQRHRNTYPP